MAIAGCGWLRFRGGPVAGSPRRTKSGRSKELGQDRENPISASPVWGITQAFKNTREVKASGTADTMAQAFKNRHMAESFGVMLENSSALIKRCSNMLGHHVFHEKCPQIYHGS